MEIKNFRSVTFGGFDKEEVIQYVQKTAQENTDEQEALRKDNSALREENEALKKQLEVSLREQAETARREGTELREKIRSLTAELEELRPQALSYQEVRAQVGDIECQARRRAGELETATTARLNALVSDIQKQYQDLAGAFDVTAVQVTAELRKIEVGLSQLPRAMDQAGKELSELVSAAGGEKKA
ncbi:hypothetical protein [Oscillibacter sp. GMB15532]|uniref:hypothetical protein n=1 Tax=Oscillibacter sp. GMB15532 TaxID=3230022 RepID=UPI0034E0222C